MLTAPPPTYTNGKNGHNGNGHNGNGHHAPADLFPPPPPLDDPDNMSYHQPPSLDAGMPSDKDAERALLGSALIDPEVASRIDSLVQPSDFYYLRHATLCEAMIRLAADNRPADFVTILDELRIMGKEDDVHPHEITALFNATPSSAYADHYASIVKMHAYNRRAIAIAGKIAEKAYASPRAEELHSFIQEQLYTLAAPASDHSAIVPWADSHRRYLDILEKREEQAKLGPSPSRWPWAKFNEVLGPIEPGFVVEVAGDTGGFKTVLVECITETWARNGCKVAYFHCELPEGLVMDRRMCRWGSIHRKRLLSGQLSDFEWKIIMEVSGKLSQWPGTVDYVYSGGWDVDRIAREIEYMQQTMGITHVVIDHLKNLPASSRQNRSRMDKTERQGDNVSVLKNTASRIKPGLPPLNLLLINQMTKGERSLSDIKLMTKDGIGGSGEQVDLVNAVILLDRGKATTIEKDPKTKKVVAYPGDDSFFLDFQIGKNTGGAAPVFGKLWLDPPYFRIRDIEIESVDLSD